MPALVPQIEADEAISIIVGRASAVEEVVATRLIYHPYAGVGYVVDRTTFGQSRPLSVHTMVDLRNGSPAICEPWPELAPGVDDRDVPGPTPIIGERTARRQSRHCVLRALLKRRFALRQPVLTEVEYISPLYKPNWILDLRIRGTGGMARVLVDGLSGRHHSMASPSNASGDGTTPVSERLNT